MQVLAALPVSTAAGRSFTFNPEPVRVLLPVAISGSQQRLVVRVLVR